jgi:hypothetical protein
MSSNILNDYNYLFNFKDISEFMIQNFNNNKGFFLNRIGGSDYKAVEEYFNNNINESNFDYYYDSVCNYNGYFDKTKDKEVKKKNFFSYLEMMLQSYTNSEAYSNPCATLENTNNFNKVSNSFNKYIVGNKVCFNYGYFEGVNYFLNDFKIWGEKKNILIISPFSKSIKYQDEINGLNNILKDYQFPNCKILTYNTPITYNNNDDDLKIFNLDSNNWIEQCEKMCKEVSLIDFDIALLACGSYATYLGSFISKNLNKKAVYIGGILNVYFNIYGKRYDTPFFNSKVNLNFRIVALEKNDIEKIKGGRKCINESLNAYF